MLASTFQDQVERIYIIFCLLIVSRYQKLIIPDFYTVVDHIVNVDSDNLFHLHLSDSVLMQMACSKCDKRDIVAVHNDLNADVLLLCGKCLLLSHNPVTFEIPINTESMYYLDTSSEQNISDATTIQLNQCPIGANDCNASDIDTDCKDNAPSQLDNESDGLYPHLLYMYLR
eukprot:177593_1